MKKKTKITIEEVKKLSFDKNGRVKMNINQVAKKLGCTRGDIRKVIKENL